MKRLFLILISLILLTGCTAIPPETTVPETALPPTEQPEPWVEVLGTPWDPEGTLVELPLNIPNGLSYVSHMTIDGDLLFWTQDDHRKDRPRIQLCVLDLDTGEVSAQKDIAIHATMMPQVLGENLYICDNTTGIILKLDKALNILQQWQTDIRDSGIYMDAMGNAYVTQWGAESYRMSLETGEKLPVLDENTPIYGLESTDGYLKVTYYHPDSGEECVAFLDLYSGHRYDAPVSGNFGCQYADGLFLLNSYEESFEYTLIPADGQALETDLGYNQLVLMEQGLLLRISEGSNRISIHDCSGKALAGCTLSDRDYGYETIELISSDAFGGYFVVLSNHGGGIRLLYWDMTGGTLGEDIPFTPVPAPSEMDSQIRMRVDAIEAQYGLNILVGEAAADYFYDFEAAVVTDPTDTLDALDTLEEALKCYPEGFFRQLRYGDIRRTEIHLMGAITATNSEYTDTYEAFVQDGFDCHVMVMDIYLSDETTYFHEFSHIIDSYLQWDSWNREDALFSDDTWCSLNPGWFQGYTYSYSWEQHVEDYGAFVDSYSTINPTEDRARVMEYAMADHGAWAFEDAAILQEKLSYYCRCIRDAFDTAGWPETLLWEQYLP